VQRLVNSTYVSLDGVIENPQDWPPSGVEDEAAGTIQTDLLLASDAVLMGRRTYESFAPAWTTRSGDPFSDRINSMPKYVVSGTLKEPKWANTTVIADDPIAEIRRLKERQNIVEYGFGRLCYALMEHGLLDELRLWVHPFFVGAGGPQDLMYRDSRLTKFTLADVTPLKSGTVILTYNAGG
jgi:dihydrofolate reductase